MTKDDFKRMVTNWGGTKKYPKSVKTLAAVAKHDAQLGRLVDDYYAKCDITIDASNAIIDHCRSKLEKK